MAKNDSEVAPVGDSEKKPSRKWAFLVLAVVLSFGALAGGLVASMGVEKTLGLVMGDDAKKVHGEKQLETKADGAVEGAIETAAEDNIKEKSLTVSPLKEIIVNIVSITETGRKSSRFLKVNLALVFDENVVGSKHVIERKVYIRDAFQNYLRQLTERDLAGSIGVVRLKSELLRRARAVTESDAPQEVLIADIIVQ